MWPCIFLCINDHDDNSFCHTFACNKKPANAHVFWRTKLVQSSFGEPKFFVLPWEYTFLINGAFQIIFCFNTQKTHISHIVDHVKKPVNLYAFWRSRRRPDLHRICGRRPKKLSAALLLCIKYLKRGQDTLIFFYKQPVYKQRGLKSEFAKQLSSQILLFFVNISNKILSN